MCLDNGYLFWRCFSYLVLLYSKTGLQEARLGISEIICILAPTSPTTCLSRRKLESSWFWEVSTHSSCTLVIFAAVAQSIHLILCLVSCHYFSDSGSQVVILGIFWQQRPQSDLPKRGFHLWSRWSKIVSPYSCCPTALQIYPQQRAHNMIQPNTKVCFSQHCFFHKINQCKFGGRATTKT